MKKTISKPTRCYTCNSPDHLARDCKATKSESRGKLQVVRTGGKSTEPHISRFSRIVDSIFRPIQPTDRDTKDTQTTPKSVEVQIEGVPIRGIVDTGSDITILNRATFQGIVTACVLKREQFKHALIATNP